MNDDQLTRDLGAAFRDATSDLTYGGRVPTPHRSPLLVVPVTAAAAIAVLVPVALHDDPASAPSAGPGTVAPFSTSPATTRTTSAAPPTVLTEKVRLAGFTVRYHRSAGEQGPLVARTVAELPDDATPVDLSDMDAVPAKAWTGTEPTTGDAAIFVKVSTRFEGELFDLSGPGWTKDQLIAVFKGGEPQVVPHVD